MFLVPKVLPKVSQKVMKNHSKNMSWERTPKRKDFSKYVTFLEGKNDGFYAVITVFPDYDPFQFIHRSGIKKPSKNELKLHQKPHKNTSKKPLKKVNKNDTKKERKTWKSDLF